MNRIGAAFLLLGLWGCSGADESGTSSGDVPSVVLLAVDGASWTVMGPMIEAGQLPHFGRLMRDGATMQRFETLASTSSPVVWTTVATGRDVADHGVRDFKEVLPGGEVIPVTSNSRSAIAIWEVASRHDVSVGVLNWWASWPAETVNGYVVSDHANPALAAFFVRDGNYWTADPEQLARLRRDFYPLDLAPILEQVASSPEEFSYDELQRRGAFGDAQIAAIREAPWNERSALSVLKTFYASDLTVMRAALRLRRERPVQLQMIYLRGPDPLQHYAWDLVEPEAFARVPETLDRDRGIVEGIYRVIDGMLGELLELLPEDTWLIVASDHGAEPGPQARNPRPTGRPGAHTPAAKGVLFVHGPHVRPGFAIQAADPADLTPTLLWLLDLPVSEELVGEPITRAFERSFVDSRPLRRIASYGSRETRPGLPSAADEAMLESLRALGYIE